MTKDNYSWLDYRLNEYLGLDVERGKIKQLKQTIISQIEIEKLRARIDAMQQAKSRVLRRTEIPADAKEPTRDIVVITGEECARIIDLDISDLTEKLKERVIISLLAVSR